MTSRSSDDEIEMEKRRIREVGLCVTSQEEIVVRLELVGADDLAGHGRESLAHFHAFLTIARARLVSLEREWSANARQSDHDTGIAERGRHAETGYLCDPPPRG